MPKHESHAVVSGDELRDIVIDRGVSIVPVEASGLVYLKERAAYVVVSDETERKRPELFLMDNNGRITTKSMVEGLKKINDMEGITSDERGFLYLLTSQSYNRKGERSAARRLLARVRREGASFVLDKSVILADLLLSAAADAGNADWANYVRRATSEKSIDIEGIAVRGDTLFLGFKNPKIDNKAVIMAIANPDDVFEQNRLMPKQVSLWRTLILNDKVTGTFCGISDLLFHGNFLYGVSTGVSIQSGVEEDVGLFWNYAPATGTMSILRSFPGLKPEGLAISGDSSTFCLVFDNGSRNPSQLMMIKVAR